MAHWLTGAFFVTTFIAIIIEVLLDRRKGWKDDPESQGEQVDAANQTRQGDAVSQPRQQDDGKNQEEPGDTENEVPKEEELQETTPVES